MFSVRAAGLFYKQFSTFLNLGVRGLVCLLLNIFVVRLAIESLDWFVYILIHSLLVIGVI